MSKNILIISSKSADFGGVEFHVLDLIKAFSKENKVYVMCPNGALVNDYTTAGAEVIEKTPKTPYDFSFAKFVSKFCTEKSINIVHCHELISAQGLLGAFIADVPVRLWHIHTPFLKWKYPNLLIKIIKTEINWVTNFFIANFLATTCIALTHEIKNHRKMFEFVLFKPIVVIPNGIDTALFSRNVNNSSLVAFKQKFKIPVNKVITGSLSRTSAEKGQIILFKAFDKLNKTYPNKYFLLLAGGGELQNSLQEFGDKHFKNNFLITGKFKDSDKPLFYKIMDYFVFPSLAEGFGYAPIEAAASKKVVIASDLPVLKNVGGKGTYFFKTGDFKDLYKVLLSVLNTDEKTLKNRVVSNFEKAKEYSLENFKKNYSKVYKI